MSNIAAVGTHREGASSSREGARAALLESLNFQLPARDPGKSYRWAVGFLAAGLVISVGLFVLLLGFLAWLAVFHTISAFASLGKGPYFLFHGPMALLAIVLLVFLLKPVFIRRRGELGASIELTRENEPFLFEYVTRLATAVGAPAPVRIIVDCEANASASFDRGIFGLIGRRMTLRVGLPLVAALNVQQFSGVLAHEFGHFSQRSGMIGSFLIRTLHFFLRRVVFQRDRLDALLLRLRHMRNPFVRATYWVAVGFIEPARGILWALLVAGDFISCHTLRRMEHDADTVEGNIVGSEAFAATDLAVFFLQISDRRAHDFLNRCWTTQRLADNYPRLVVSDAKTLRGRFPNIVKDICERATSPFDTHPSHADRAAFVKDLKVEGRLKCTQKSGLLFANFDGLCLRATRDLYRGYLKEDLDKATLVSTRIIAEEWQAQSQGFDRLHAYFRGYAATERPMFPDPDARYAPDDVKAAAADLVAARNALAQAAEGLTPKIRQAREAAAEFTVGAARQQLAEIFSRSPQAARVRRMGQRQVREAQRILQNVRPQISPFEHAVQSRFTLALRFMQVPKIAAKVPEAAAAKGLLARFLPLGEVLREADATVTRLRDDALTLRVLCVNHNPRQPYGPLVERILATSGSMLQTMQELRETLSQKYPFEHSQEEITVGAYFLPEKLPEKNDPQGVAACATMLFDRYASLTFRVLSQLAEIAGRLEEAVGLPALPAMPESDPEEEAARKKASRRAAFTAWASYGGRAVAGVVLMALLVWWSMNPPTMEWSESGEAIRPAAFSASFDSYAHYMPTVAPAPAAWPEDPNFPRPGGRQRGGRIGGQDWSAPGFSDVNPSSPGPRITPRDMPRPTPVNPAPYRPVTPPPRYTPPPQPRYTPPARRFNPASPPGYRGAGGGRMPGR
ncbi:MAG TPA: M48 family metalloprotease [Phycisphaerae bacterium]|nr:M48 family metalloprotease [Phycisphaerae bacterium]